MALLWTCSADLDTTAADEWDFFNSVNYTSVAARNGIHGLQHSNGSYCGKQLPNTQTWIAGTALQMTVINGSPGESVFTFIDGAGPTIQVSIGVSVNYQVQAYRGNQSGGTLLGQSALVIPNPLNTWHYIQAKVVIGAAPIGFVEILVDGVTYLSLSGINTQATANAFANQFYLQNSGQNIGTAYMDDVYVCDGTGNQDNNYLGDVTIVGQVPVANGTVNNFQRGGSTVNAQNWQQVNDIPPDGDTTYVFDSNVGDEDGYTYGALAQTGATIYSIAFKPRARKDDSGVRSMQLAHLSQGVEVYGANIPLSMSYANYFLSQPLDPATGQPWTIAGVNGCEQRIKIAA